MDEGCDSTHRTNAKEKLKIREARVAVRVAGDVAKYIRAIANVSLTKSRVPLAVLCNRSATSTDHEKSPDRQANSLTERTCVLPRSSRAICRVGDLGSGSPRSGQILFNGDAPPAVRPHATSITSSSHFFFAFYPNSFLDFRPPKNLTLHPTHLLLALESAAADKALSKTPYTYTCTRTHARVRPLKKKKKNEAILCGTPTALLEERSIACFVRRERDRRHEAVEEKPNARGPRKGRLSGSKLQRRGRNTRARARVGAGARSLVGEL